jgi:phage baseplate assembly protein W
MKYQITSDDVNIRWGLTGADRIVQNVLNIIRTRKGEVMFMFPLGIDPEFTDGRIEYLRRNIVDELTEQLATYESRATLLSVAIKQVDEDMHIRIDVELEVE